MTEMMWLNRTTGQIRPYVEGEVLAGYGPETHDVVPHPPELSAGTHDWDPDTRMCIPAAPTPPQPLPPPDVVSRRQLRLALYQSGLEPAVDAFIAQADAVTRINWQDATEFRRTHPSVQLCAIWLDKTEEDVDDLFRLAGSFTEDD